MEWSGEIEAETVTLAVGDESGDARKNSVVVEAVVRVVEVERQVIRIGVG